MKLSKEVKIGIFVLVVLVLFFWGLNYLKGKDILNSSDEYYAIYDEIEGLGGSAPVTINGFKVGQILDIELLPEQNNKVRVELSIDSDYKIPLHTIAAIVSSDIMGNKAINLIYPETISGYHTSGDTLESRIDEGLTGAIDDLQGSVGSTISHLDSILTNLNRKLEPMDDNRLNEITYHLNQSLKDLDQQLRKGGDLASTIKNMNEISGNLASKSDQIGQTLDNLTAISDSLSTIQYQQTIGSITSLIQGLDTLVFSINNGEGTIGQLAKNDSLYSNLNSVTESLNLLLQDMKEHPKRYVHFSLFGKKDN